MVPRSLGGTGPLAAQARGITAKGPSGLTKSSGPLIFACPAPDSAMHVILLSWSLAIAPTSVSACEDPSLAALVPPAEPTDSLEVEPYIRLHPWESDLNLGIGRLFAVDNYAWDWQDQIRLPLFAQPGGEPFAWIMDGWLIEDGATVGTPYGASGMVETGYEISAFVVFGRRADGWVRFRYRPGSDIDGSAWTHECFFDAVEGVTLAVELWQDRFLSDEISPLYFRAEVRHSLRAGPSTDTERILWIPAEQSAYTVEPIEVQDEWMRAKVTIPSTYCYGPDAPPSTETEGWVKWRDDEVGPWLWYYTRGC